MPESKGKLLPNLWQSLAVPPRWVPWIYVIAFATCGIAGATVVDGVYHGFTLDSQASLLSASASLLVAFGTILLASYTAASVRGTAAIIETENKNHRVSSTITLVNRFTEVPMQLTEDFKLPAGAALVVLMRYSEAELREIASRRDSNEASHRRFAFLANCRNVIDFYFMTAYQQLNEDLLDNRLFFNSLAGSYVEAKQCIDRVTAAFNMQDVNPVIHRKLLVRCQGWLDEHRTPGEREGAVPAGIEAE